jgi:hypothetical protein
MLQVDLVVSRSRNRPLVQPAGTLLIEPYRVRFIMFPSIVLTQTPPLRISFFVSRLPSSLLSPAYLFHYFFLHNEPSRDCNWSDPMVLKRKAHTKSRTGCGTCKRRRIKVWPISYANICSDTRYSATKESRDVRTASGMKLHVYIQIWCHREPKGQAQPQHLPDCHQQLQMQYYTWLHLRTILSRPAHHAQKRKSSPRFRSKTCPCCTIGQ